MGIISTWNGMTMDATIMPRSAPQAFQLLRTMTKAVMEENTIVSTVEQMVIKAEFRKERPKFIFFMASGKLAMVKPWAPTNARGLEVISAFVLNTLITTRTKGNTKHTNRAVRIRIFTT